MGLKEDLMAAIPSLKNEDFSPLLDIIVLQDDSDGLGVFIAKWEYAEPLPESFKVGK
jgi:hypothetical protein